MHTLFPVDPRTSENRPRLIGFRQQEVVFNYPPAMIIRPANAVLLGRTSIRPGTRVLAIPFRYPQRLTPRREGRQDLQCDVFLVEMSNQLDIIVSS